VKGKRSLLGEGNIIHTGPGYERGRVAIEEKEGGSAQHGGHSLRKGGPGFIFLGPSACIYVIRVPTKKVGEKKKEKRIFVPHLR